MKLEYQLLALKMAAKIILPQSFFCSRIWKGERALAAFNSLLQTTFLQKRLQLRDKEDDNSTTRTLSMRERRLLSA